MNKRNSNNNPLIVICGPTATGKTEYALKLAREKNGELISADSRQIYKHLDIGTGKDLSKNSVFVDQTDLFEVENPGYNIGFYSIYGTPLWLYDVINPNQTFSASEYARIAREVIKDIWSRKKTPIVVGGTGFYIQALVDGIDTEGIPPNEELRKQFNNKTIEQLQKHLKELSPERLSEMNNSDRNNPRRLIRAIEVSELQPQTIRHDKENRITDNVEFIGLNFLREELFKRIDVRVEKRVQQGIVDEIKSLLEKGYDWNSPGLSSIGYKEWQPYFEGMATKEEVIERWKFNEYAYAKRQETWFKKDTRIKWIQAS